MTLALLLERAGDLAKAGLICRACEEDPERKRRLGCLETPIVTYRVQGQPDEDDVWTPERFHAFSLAVAGGDEEDARELRQGRDLATWAYPEAAVGDIDENVGVWWDCCPRSYALFAPRARLDVAEGAIKTALSLRSGIPHQWLFGEARPSSRYLSLIQLALDWMDRRERRAKAPTGGAA